MRPATTLPSRPGNVLLLPRHVRSEMRSHTACTSSSGRPCSRSAFTQTGRCRRAPISTSSSCPEVTPQDDADAVALTWGELLAQQRVLQHQLRGDQREELGVSVAGDEARRDAVLQRVEIVRGKKGPAAGVGLVGSRGVGIVEILDQPVGWRDGPIRSRPARMSRQKPQASDEPGNSALTPTTARGGRGSGIGLPLTRAAAARRGTLILFHGTRLCSGAGEASRARSVIDRSTRRTKTENGVRGNG